MEVGEYIWERREVSGKNNGVRIWEWVCGCQCEEGRACKVADLSYSVYTLGEEART